METLTGTVQHYAWGSHTAIPEILGTLPTPEPQAEYWLGAHPSAPSNVAGQDLDALLEHHPEWLGGASREAFGTRLPYLLKILAADQPLSLQAHPTAEQAVAGFARENEDHIPLNAPERTYKDDWPKPELIVALTEFDALCGFRPPAESAALFDALGVSDEVSSIVGPLSERTGEAATAEVFLDVLSLAEDRRHLVDVVVAAAVKHVGDEGPVGEFARTAVELDEFHPGSPGIIAGLLLNRVRLQPYQGLYLDAGVMHAYLRGTGVEIMANSDNVLRGGLTPKHIDVDELVSVVTFAPTDLALVEQRAEADGVVRYVTPAPHFALWRIDARHTPAAVPGSGARVLLVVEGEAVVRCGEEYRELPHGQAVLLRDDEHDVDVTSTNGARLFLAGAGV